MRFRVTSDIPLRLRTGDGTILVDDMRASHFQFAVRAAHRRLAKGRRSLNGRLSATIHAADEVATDNLFDSARRD